MSIPLAALALGASLIGAGCSSGATKGGTEYKYEFSTLTAYMNAPHTFHLKRNPSNLMRNATSELDRMLGQVLTPMLNVISSGLTGVVVMLLVLLLVISFPSLALVLI